MKSVYTPGLSPVDSGKKIYFVRHGRTDWNNRLVFQGKTDVPLNEEGRLQATSVAERFKNTKPDIIISSPLSRALETARKISSFHKGSEFIATNLLTEINFASWEGHSAPEIINAVGADFFAKWRENPFGVSIPGAESADELFARCRRFKDILSNLDYQNIVVVGHGGMYRALFLVLLNLPASGFFWRLRIDNCSITTFAERGSGAFDLVSLNDIIHMKAEKNISIDLLPI